jgi:hypothetical protein
MKAHQNWPWLLLLYILFSLSSGLAEENRFKNSLTFKGVVDGNKLENSECSLTVNDSNIVLVPKAGKSELIATVKGMKVEDFALAPSGEAMALNLSSQTDESHISKVVTVDSKQEMKSFSSEIIDPDAERTWIIELGGVSASGKAVLLKAAYHPAPTGGSYFVRHRWIIVSLEEEGWKVMERDFAIDRWSNYSSVKH